MMLQVCPKCQFRLAPGRHICSTCGFVVVSKRDVKGGAQSKAAPSTVSAALRNAKVEKRGFWASLFSTENESPKEQRRDEPALGET